MNKIFISIFIIVSIFTLTACGDKKKSKNNANKNETTGSINPASTNDANKKEKAIVSFKVNGIEANTAMGSSNDNAAQLGMFNKENKFFGLTLNGDDPKFPHRGYLNISIENYNLQPGAFQCKVASFSRYATANAGGETQYDVIQGGNCTLKIESIVKTSPVSESIEEYAISGTFNGKFGLKKGWENEVKEIIITEGNFKDVRVSVLGRKK